MKKKLNKTTTLLFIMMVIFYALCIRYTIKYENAGQELFNEQNKTTDVNGVTIEVHQFIELAIKALASGPLLD